MLKLENIKAIFIFTIVFSGLFFLTNQAETLEKHNCTGIQSPCNSKGICHSKGFCICRNNYYG